MPMSTVRPPFHAAQNHSLHGNLVVRGLLQLVPHLQTLRLVVADEIATFGLFALDNDFNRIAGIELGHAIGVQNLLERDQTFGLQTDVDHDMLVGDLDHRAGHDDLFGRQVCGCCGLGCLLAIEVGQGGSKVCCVVIRLFAGVEFNVAACSGYRAVVLDLVFRWSSDAGRKSSRGLGWIQMTDRNARSVASGARVSISVLRGLPSL